MTDDSGRARFGRRRARRQAFTLGAIALAACDTAAPPDDALLSELSGAERMALCDELRDPVTAEDRPVQCGSSERMFWILPSNGSCLSADLSSCDATAGELRSCHEDARANPCALPTDDLVDFENSGPIRPGPDCTFMQRCVGLAPRATTVVTDSCVRVDLPALQSFDGVYERVGEPQSSDGPGSPGTLPAVLESGSLYFVLVSTEASGSPEAILQSCSTLAECRVLARELRATGEPRGSTPSNQLLGCSYPFEPGLVILRSVPSGVLGCETPWQPRVSVMRDAFTGDGSSLIVTIGGQTDAPEISPGCGYVIPSGSPSTELVYAPEVLRATLVATL